MGRQAWLVSTETLDQMSPLAGWRETDGRGFPELVAGGVCRMSPRT